MGTWALAPWDNDIAADWYGSLMDRTKLRDVWLEGINENPEESPDIVRAAAALFVMLGRVYIWPIENYDDDLEMAIDALSQVQKCDNYSDTPEIIELITQELEELKSRRKPNKPTTEIQPERKSWWRFW